MFSLKQKSILDIWRKSRSYLMTIAFASKSEHFPFHTKKSSVAKIYPCNFKISLYVEWCKKLDLFWPIQIQNICFPSWPSTCYLIYETRYTTYWDGIEVGVDSEQWVSLLLKSATNICFKMIKKIEIILLLFQKMRKFEKKNHPNR